MPTKSIENRFSYLKRQAREEAWKLGHHPEYLTRVKNTEDRAAGEAGCFKCEAKLYVDTEEGFKGTMLEHPCPYRPTRYTYLVVVDDPDELAGFEKRRVD